MNKLDRYNRKGLMSLKPRVMVFVFTYKNLLVSLLWSNLTIKKMQIKFFEFLSGNRWAEVVQKDLRPGRKDQIVTNFIKRKFEL